MGAELSERQPLGPQASCTSWCPLPTPPLTHFLGSVKVMGLGGVSSLFFQPAGKCLFRPLCLEKKDLGTEAESWKELD